MATIVSVRFKKPGKVYFFDPGSFADTIRVGDTLVVETVRGLELGECTVAAMEISDDEIMPPLRRVTRIATERDLQQVENNRENERNAYTICQDKILSHKIEMKLVDVEYAFDNSKVIFYFTANGRVDFRSLVKDLASVFKTRIELRQIGVRDEAKMLGGLGPCGRAICCGTFLGDFQPVSIKMAKEQNLSLNPTKISGLCGRLMCCLKYEQDYYEEARKKLPRVGKDVMTPDGRGHVIDVNVLRLTAKVRMPVGDTTEVREYKSEELQRMPPPEHDKRPLPPKRQDRPEKEERPEKEKAERHERPEKGRKGAHADRPAHKQHPPRAAGPEETAGEAVVDALIAPEEIAQNVLPLEVLAEEIAEDIAVIDEFFEELLDVDAAQGDPDAQ